MAGFSRNGIAQDQYNGRKCELYAVMESGYKFTVGFSREGINVRCQSTCPVNCVGCDVSLEHHGILQVMLWLA